MRRCIELIAAAAFVVATATAQAEGVPKLDEAAAFDFSQQAIGTVPPDFTLLDRRERPVRLSEYRGKPLLISFIYTGCFTICPTQTRSLYEAVKGLDRMLGPHQFNVVSVGFNQPFDSPAAMRTFAAQQRIDYPNWEFLAPHPKIVDPLTQAYGFKFQQTPAGFDHVVGVTVVDAQGRIHSQVYGQKLSAEALGVPLRQLLLYAPPPERMPTFADLVDRVRILCTVYDEETGQYRYDWKLVFELIAGVGFFLTMIIYFGRELRSQRRARKAAEASAPSGSMAPGAMSTVTPAPSAAAGRSQSA